jgi:S-adenosylmethionine/arginine decarboxylase-like enzyme
LSESHIAVHTWPERAAALWSIGCCRPLPPDDDIRAWMNRCFSSTQIVLSRVARGVL